MRKLYTTKLINRPEIKFSIALDYTLPCTWPKSTQAEIQKWRWHSGLSYITQNSLPFVSFGKEGIINVFVKTVLPLFSNIYNDRQ